MKSKKLFVSLCALSFVLSAGANAFGLPKVLGSGSGSGSSSSASAKDVAKNAQNALLSFAAAKIGLAAALGGYAELSANRETLEGLKKGDVAATKTDIETVVTMNQSLDKFIDNQITSNAPLDAKQKSVAAKATADYVKGLVSSKKLVSSVQDLAKNPMSLGLDAGPIVYLGKELPSVISGGVSTTSVLLKYMSANGVDMTEANAAADGMGS